MFIKWCSDYIKDRSMRVKYTNIYGTPITCPSVPQGSVIGPYLFALFMGSLRLPESMYKNDYQIILYADDIMLIEPFFNPLHTHVSASLILVTAVCVMTYC